MSLTSNYGFVYPIRNLLGNMLMAMFRVRLPSLDASCFHSIITLHYPMF